MTLTGNLLREIFISQMIFNTVVYLNRLNYFLDLMVRRASAFDMAGGILSIFPWIRYFAPKKSGYEILVKLNNELREFLLESIDEHKKNYVEGKEMDLIDMFLKEMYTGQGPEAGFTGIYFYFDTIF